MSVVVSTITHEFAVISGDFRATYEDFHTEDNFNKIFNINNILVGFVGDGTIPKMINYKKLNLKNIINVDSAEDFAFDFLNKFCCGIVKKKFVITIMGLDKDGIPSQFAFTNESRSFDYMEKLDLCNKIDANIVIPGGLIGCKTEDYYKLLKNKKNNINDYINAQKQFISNVSKIDNSVSQKSKTIIIKYNRNN